MSEEKGNTMKPKRLAYCMERLDLDQETLSKLLDCTDRTVRRWLSGAGEIPRSVALLLELMVLHEIQPHQLDALNVHR